MGFARVSTSQPLAATPSQSAKPVAQLKPQVPLAQVVVAFARVGQAFAQPPQWATLVRVSISQPLVATPSQFPKFGLQAKPQLLAAQATVALARAAQALLQTPQCIALVRKSTQSPPHSVRPAPQIVPQRPALQT